MRRISTATKVVDKFGPGKHGFTDGDVIGGVPSTDLEAALFDHLQEEVAGVIEALGTALDPNDRTQLQVALRGRQIGHRVFTSSTTYTPTPGTAFVEIEVVGGGGAGGGVPTTTSGQVAVAPGGSSGGRAIGRFAVAAVTGQAITVGAAGVGVANAAGGNGGASSVGALISANGGTGGTVGAASGGSSCVGNATQAAASGGNIFNETGKISRLAIVVFGFVAYGGDGGEHAHGSGGQGFASPLGTLSGDGFAATGYGAGGGGALATTSNATTRKGGNAGAGVVTFKEFA